MNEEVTFRKGCKSLFGTSATIKKKPLLKGNPDRLTLAFELARHCVAGGRVFYYVDEVEGIWRLLETTPYEALVGELGIGGHQEPGTCPRCKHGAPETGAWLKFEAASDKNGWYESLPTEIRGAVEVHQKCCSVDSRHAIFHDIDGSLDAHTDKISSGENIHKGKLKQQPRLTDALNMARVATYGGIAYFLVKEVTVIIRYLEGTPPPFASSTIEDTITLKAAGQRQAGTGPEDQTVLLPVPRRDPGMDRRRGHDDRPDPPGRLLGRPSP
jgi:hypothetical protein